MIIFSICQRLKHVRSEKDPYTLMRMIMVNVFNTVKTLRWQKKWVQKIFLCFNR